MSCRLLSLVVFVEGTSGHPRPSSVEAPVYCGCPAWSHRCAPKSRMTLRQRANPQPFFGVDVGVLGGVTSCILCARISRVLRDVKTTGRISCATENSCTPARLEALSKLSVVTVLSHWYHFHQILCSFQLVILFEMFFTSFDGASLKCSCLLSAVSQSVLFTLM